MAFNRHPNSIETVLTFDNRDTQSQWSEVWSTAHVASIDNASGGRTQTGVKGRRRLSLGSLALGGFLTMHCRVAASAITGGFFVFMMFLIMATAALANPLRHFEVYLGQWSINGPGRAFRILPLCEGIGIAICINALLRAMICCIVASIAAIYLIHAISDSKLPYTYCRNFDLRPYDPIVKDINLIMLKESRFSLVTGELHDGIQIIERATVGTEDVGWRNASYRKLINKRPKKTITRKIYENKIQVCNETYSTGYPSLYSTTQYNFFYVEVVLFREHYNLFDFNVPLMLCIVFAWSVLWILLIIERLTHGRLIWNNTSPWLVAVPWIWTGILVITATMNLASMPRMLRNVYRIGAKEVLTCFVDALEVALYIHSASVGTEMIHGKGLNHYASGHIDPSLNGENIWHSGLLLLLTGLHSGGATICALVDSVQTNTKPAYNMHESTLWIIPMYSKCTMLTNYSHLVSALVFGGLMFSYMTVAFVLVKTSLHTIFEYKVKLVFAEQAVVAGIILTCMGLSVLFATTGGVALLESVDTIMTGVSMPFICLLELVTLLYFYRSHDFVSDMNIATEENACSSRIGTQWQILPAVMLVTLLIKLSVIWSAEMPLEFMYGASAALAAVVLAPAARAVRNAYKFLRSQGDRRPK